MVMPVKYNVLGLIMYILTTLEFPTHYFNFYDMIVQFFINRKVVRHKATVAVHLTSVVPVQHTD